MAPLHHHFELSGWSETQITQRFVMITMIASLIGISLALTFDQPQFVQQDVVPTQAVSQTVQE